MSDETDKKGGLRVDRLAAAMEAARTRAKGGPSPAPWSAQDSQHSVTASRDDAAAVPPAPDGPPVMTTSPPPPDALSVPTAPPPEPAAFEPRFSEPVASVSRPEKLPPLILTDPVEMQPPPSLFTSGFPTSVIRPARPVTAWAPAPPEPEAPAPEIAGPETSRPEPLSATVIPPEPEFGPAPALPQDAPAVAPPVLPQIRDAFPEPAPRVETVVLRDMPDAPVRREPARPAIRARAIPVLTLSGVKTDIGRYHILDGIDLEVSAGGVTMLLGRNGAGKTTTLRTIMGLWQARAGRIIFRGEDIARWSTPRIAQSGIGYVPEDMGVFGDLTVAENMVLAATSGRIAADRLDWIFATFPPLKTFWKSPAGTLSGGQKQMLSIARAMIEKRQLYLIDEPTKGLAPVIVATLVSALRNLKAEGASILMVEQNFNVACALGDTCVVMEDGRSIWSGEMAELADDLELADRLMGLSLTAKDNG